MYQRMTLAETAVTARSVLIHLLLMVSDIIQLIPMASITVCYIGHGAVYVLSVIVDFRGKYLLDYSIMVLGYGKECAVHCWPPWLIFTRQLALISSISTLASVLLILQ